MSEPSLRPVETPALHVAPRARKEQHRGHLRMAERLVEEHSAPSASCTASAGTSGTAPAGPPMSSEKTSKPPSHRQEALGELPQLDEKSATPCTRTFASRSLRAAWRAC